MSRSGRTFGPATEACDEPRQPSHARASCGHRNTPLSYKTDKKRLVVPMDRATIAMDWISIAVTCEKVNKHNMKRFGHKTNIYIYIYIAYCIYSRNYTENHTTPKGIDLGTRTSCQALQDILSKMLTGDTTSCLRLRAWRARFQFCIRLIITRCRMTRSEQEQGGWKRLEGRFCTTKPHMYQ